MCAITVLVQPRRDATVRFNSPFLRNQHALVSYPRSSGQLIYPVKLAVFYLPVGGMDLGISRGAAVVDRCFDCRIRWYGHALLTGRLLWIWDAGWPVIGLIQVGAQARADRYTYLSQSVCASPDMVGGRV